jgi:two-component system, NtrC family, sensor kinase
LALPEVFRVLIVSAVKLCADDGVIYLKRGDVFVAEADFEGDAKKISARNLTPRRPGRESVTGRVALSGQVEQIPDNLADPEFTVAPALRLKGIRSMLGVPLLRGGEVVGVFVLGRRAPGLFSDRAVEQARTFADQAVIAIENARLFNEVQDKARDLEESLAQQMATANVLKVISRSAFDLKAVFDMLIRSAVELVGAAHGTIHIREGDVYAHRASFGFNSELLSFVNRHRFLPGRETLAGRVALSGTVESIPDVLVDREYLPSMKASINVRSLLGVPLLRDDGVEGMMILARDEPGRFTPRQIELVETFADQALIAIENTRLFEEVQAKTRDLSEALVHQTASGNILKVIASSPTKVAPALQAIVDSACEVCGAYDAAVILREGDQVRFSAHCGPILIGLETWPLSRAWVGGRSIVDRAPIHVPDLQRAGEEFPDGRDFALPMGHRTILAAPLMREAESVGAIVVRRKEAHPFSDKQIELLRTFADQAVIAIGNVRLFDQVQARTRDLEESLQQQTATADVLKVISRSAFDLQVVLTTLAESARELCGASFVTLFMRDKDEMRLRAESGCTPEIVAFLHAHPIICPTCSPIRNTISATHRASATTARCSAFRFCATVRSKASSRSRGRSPRRMPHDKSKWCAPSPTKP